MKVVINKCFGGFGISPKAALRMYELGAKELAMPVDEYYGVERDPDSIIGKKASLEDWRKYKASGNSDSSFITVFSDDEKLVISQRPDDRANPTLVRVVEELGEEANGSCAELSIVEIPDGIEWSIDEYDGMEHIEEAHRTWG